MHFPHSAHGILQYFQLRYFDNDRHIVMFSHLLGKLKKMKVQVGLSCSPRQISQFCVPPHSHDFQVVRVFLQFFLWSFHAQFIIRISY